MEPGALYPWLTDHWAASQHNFDPAIAGPAHPVVLHDITVRDGEEPADLAFSYEQWGATAQLTAGGARPYAISYEPEIVGRSPRVIIGEWSNLGAVAKKLAEFGLTALPEQLQTILRQSQMAGVAHHQTLKDDEFLVIANEHEAIAAE